MNFKPRLIPIIVSIFVFFCIFMLLFLVLSNKKGLTGDALFLIGINVICLFGLYKNLWFYFVGIIYEIPLKRFSTYFLLPKIILKSYKIDEIDNLIGKINEIIDEGRSEIKIYTKDKKIAFIINKHQGDFLNLRELVNK